eukprot:jgi/Bigna1/91273/estExt_fgenesh1_pg.C_950003
MSSLEGGGEGGMAALGSPSQEEVKNKATAAIHMMMSCWLEHVESMWKDLRRTGLNLVKTSVEFDFDVLGTVSLPLRASLARPEILVDTSLDFLSVQVNTTRTLYFRVRNPSRSAPGEEREIGPVQYHPRVAGLTERAFLYMRNNLTGLSRIQLKASSTDQTLFFDMVPEEEEEQEGDDASSSSSSSGVGSPNTHYWRLSMYNGGDQEVIVTGLSVGNASCEHSSSGGGSDDKTDSGSGAAPSTGDHRLLLTVPATTSGLLTRLANALLISGGLLEEGGDGHEVSPWGTVYFTCALVLTVAAVGVTARLFQKPRSGGLLVTKGGAKKGKEGVAEEEEKEEELPSELGRSLSKDPRQRPRADNGSSNNIDNNGSSAKDGGEGGGQLQPQSLPRHKTAKGGGRDSAKSSGSSKRKSDRARKKQSSASANDNRDPPPNSSVHNGKGATTTTGKEEEEERKQQQSENSIHSSVQSTPPSSSSSRRSRRKKSRDKRKELEQRAGDQLSSRAVVSTTTTTTTTTTTATAVGKGGGSSNVSGKVPANQRHSAARPLPPQPTQTGHARVGTHDNSPAKKLSSSSSSSSHSTTTGSRTRPSPGTANGRAGSSSSRSPAVAAAAHLSSNPSAPRYKAAAGSSHRKGRMAAKGSSSSSPSSSATAAAANGSSSGRRRRRSGSTDGSSSSSSSKNPSGANSNSRRGVSGGVSGGSSSTDSPRRSSSSSSSKNSSSGGHERRAKSHHQNRHQQRHQQRQHHQPQAFENRSRRGVVGGGSQRSHYQEHSVGAGAAGGGGSSSAKYSAPSSSSSSSSSSYASTRNPNNNNNNNNTNRWGLDKKGGTHRFPMQETATGGGTAAMAPRVSDVHSRGGGRVRSNSFEGGSPSFGSTLATANPKQQQQQQQQQQHVVYGPSALGKGHPLTRPPSNYPAAASSSSKQQQPPIGTPPRRKAKARGGAPEQQAPSPMQLSRRSPLVGGGTQSGGVLPSQAKQSSHLPNLLGSSQVPSMDGGEGEMNSVSSAAVNVIYQPRLGGLGSLNLSGLATLQQQQQQPGGVGGSNAVVLGGGPTGSSSAGGGGGGGGSGFLEHQQYSSPFLGRGANGKHGALPRDTQPRHTGVASSSSPPAPRSRRISTLAATIVEIPAAAVAASLDSPGGCPPLFVEANDGLSHTQPGSAARNSNPLTRPQQRIWDPKPPMIWGSSTSASGPTSEVLVGQWGSNLPRQHLAAIGASLGSTETKHRSVVGSATATRGSSGKMEGKSSLNPADRPAFFDFLDSNEKLGDDANDT